MTDVFISYKRRLRPKVEQIAAALEALGYDVWFDAELEAGSSFSSEISEKVRTAKCVLVCWSNDAFGHGGDKHGWVIGEASIGRSRGVLVPVLLERADLDPPWNTIHTESLVGWSPTAPDQAAWRRVVEAIGRQVGRTAPASRAGAPPSVPQPRVNASTITVTGLLSAAGSALASLFLTVLPLSADTVRIALVADAVLFSAPLAWVLHWYGIVNLRRAIGVVAAFAIGALVAPLIAGWVLTVFPQPPAVDQVEFLYGAIGGFVGAILAFSAFPLLGVVRRAPSVGRIAIAAVALSLVGGLACAALDVSLTTSVIWVAPLWQLACAPLLAFVLREPQARQAAPMR